MKFGVRSRIKLIKKILIKHITTHKNYEKIMYNIKDQIHNQIYFKLRDWIYNTIRKQKSDKIIDRMNFQIHHQIYKEIDDEIYSKIYYPPSSYQIY